MIQWKIFFSHVSGNGAADFKYLTVVYMNLNIQANLSHVMQ